MANTPAGSFPFAGRYCIIIAAIVDTNNVLYMCTVQVLWQLYLSSNFDLAAAAAAARRGARLAYGDCRRRVRLAPSGNAVLG